MFGNLLTGLNFYEFSPYFKRLGNIFADIDQKYCRIADFYGFNCTGCNDNCCRTFFYHHTLIEYLYLQNGYSSLEDGIKIEVINRAEAVIEAEYDNSQRLMCPLNFRGLCILYSYRPMICRMHGIPHELHRPGKVALKGPGCAVFTEQFGTDPLYRFDRTPFYIEMAGLEREVRKAAGFFNKIKMTVAQMIL